MTINSPNVFSAKNVSEHMYSSLPQDHSLELRSPFDAVALLTHACMIAVGFRLVGLGENHKIDPAPNANEAQSLPLEWNASASGDYAFRYAHSQSSLQYLIKISRLGSKSVINGLGVGDDKVHTMDMKVTEYLSESSFPYKLQGESSGERGESMRKAFISAGRLTDAASLIKLNIIQKLAPGLHKEGYEESAHAASQSHPQREQYPPRQPMPGRGREPATDYNPLRDDRLPPNAQPRPFHDPLAEPRRPFPGGDFPPPGFEDEYEINRPLRGDIGGERRPLNIGERDLYPPGMGPHDPLRGGGYGPGGGGMHPTFDDPLFAGRRGPGGGGAGGYDGQIPPGARYDPVGPAGPRFPGGGQGGFGGGAPPNPFGGFGGNDFI